jgi:hypothetical protein
MNSDQTSTLDYLQQVSDKKETSSVCPSCGYCPTCGRGGHYHAPYVVPQPWTPTPYPWWNQPWTYTSCESTMPNNGNETKG